MEVLLVDMHHDQLEQAEDGEQAGGDPAEKGDKLKGGSLLWENPNHRLDLQVSLAHILC